MLAKLSQLLDASSSSFPIYPDPIVNKLAVTVYKYGGKHIKIKFVFHILVLFFLVVIVLEIFVIEQIVLIILY